MRASWELNFTTKTIFKLLYQFHKKRCSWFMYPWLFTKYSLAFLMKLNPEIHKVFISFTKRDFIKPTLTISLRLSQILGHTLPYYQCTIVFLPFKIIFPSKFNFQIIFLPCRKWFLVQILNYSNVFLCNNISDQSPSKFNF